MIQFNSVRRASFYLHLNCGLIDCIEQIVVQSQQKGSSCPILCSQKGKNVNRPQQFNKKGNKIKERWLRGHSEMQYARSLEIELLHLTLVSLFLTNIGDRTVNYHNSLFRRHQIVRDRLSLICTRKSPLIFSSRLASAVGAFFSGQSWFLFLFLFCFIFFLICFVFSLFL